MKPSKWRPGCGATVITEMDPLCWEYDCGDPLWPVCRDCMDMSALEVEKTYYRKKEARERTKSGLKHPVYGNISWDREPKPKGRYWMSNYGLQKEHQDGDRKDR